jgi:hypothetical protein
MVDNPPLLGILRLWQFLPKVFTSLLVKQKNYTYEPSNHEHFASGLPQRVRQRTGGDWLEGVEKVLGGDTCTYSRENKDTYMRKAFLHRKAQEDAREIALYIAGDTPGAADAFRVALERIREMLADLPEIGSIRSFNNKELAGPTGGKLR